MNDIELQEYIIYVAEKTTPPFRSIHSKTIEVPVFWDEESQQYSFTPEAYHIIDQARAEFRKELGYELTDYMIPVECPC